MSVFQSGVLSFIVGLKATSEELEQLKLMFMKLDTSKDGTLSIEEIQTGFQSISGVLTGGKQEY
jgi:Ca2+-binding EF-hand superfamily protein